MNYFDGLTILHCSCSSVDKGHTAKRFDGYYGIQYNHSGRLRLYKEGCGTRTVEGAFAFITHPGPMFEYSPPPGETRSHNFVCFRGPRVESYIESGLLPISLKNPLIRINQSEKFLFSLSEIVKCRDAGEIAKNRAVNLLEGLLLQLHEQQGPALKSNTGSVNEMKIMRLGEQIRKNPVTDWDFQGESAKLNMSYIHFRRLFRKSFGTPPCQYLMSARLEMASYLLRTTDMKISSVAEEAGIPDLFYFSRLFKKKYQFPPGEYRDNFGV